MRKPLRRRPREGEGELVPLELNPIYTTEGYQGELQSAVNTQLAIACKENPVLLSSLQEILNELGRLRDKVYGAPVNRIVVPSEGGVSVADAPHDFRHRLTKDNVILEWTPMNTNFTYYEIRKGTDWEHGDRIIITNNLQAVLDPVLVGRHDYMIRTLGSDGTYSPGISTTWFEVPPISTFRLESSVVVNSLTLAWSVPESTFRLSYFEVRRNGQLVSTTAGTFFAFSEQTGGTNIWSIIAVDIAGNRSDEVSTSIYTTGVTDYIFYDEIHWQKDGTRVNSWFSTSDGQLYFCIIQETYEEHFNVNNHWASPQVQYDAGYRPWLSPFATTGSYEEIFDFGTPISNVIITITHAHHIYYGDFTLGLQSSYSVDGLTWSPIETAASFFASSVQYVKVKVNITAEDDKSLMSLTDLAVRLNVKRENDGGEQWAYASDALGTVFSLNKEFVDVEAITVTPVSDTSVFAVYTFVDAPRPEEFSVLVYDNAGVRVTRYCRWNARGIV